MTIRLFTDENQSKKDRLIGKIIDGFAFSGRGDVQIRYRSYNIDESYGLIGDNGGARSDLVFVTHFARYTVMSFNDNEIDFCRWVKDWYKADRIFILVMDELLYDTYADKLDGMDLLFGETYEDFAKLMSNIASSLTQRMFEFGSQPLENSTIDQGRGHLVEDGMINDGGFKEQLEQILTWFTPLQ